MSIKELPPQLESSLLGENGPVHVPVLLDLVYDVLEPQKGESYLDLTVGYGGHARQILEATENIPSSVLVDRDSFAVQAVQDIVQQGAVLYEADFVSAAQDLVNRGKQFDMILADLGVSSPQLDRGERGFSFQADGPLDMRMDQRQERTAADIVNLYPKDRLIDIITRYGEEPRAVAGRIADAIIAARPLNTTAELATVIKKTYRQRVKHHPATRTFQALRIEVNQELRLIDELLPLLPRLLKKGGRAVIISFHSLEDRLIKRYFKEQASAGYEAELRLITKKPLDGATYDAHNPRSRSAKLRAVVKK